MKRFSLIEFLVLIAIVLLLIGMLIPCCRSLREKAQEYDSSAKVLASTACSAIYGVKLAFAAGPYNLVQSEKLAIAVGGRAHVSLAGAAAVTTDLASGCKGSTLVFLKNNWPGRYKVYQFPVDGEKVRADTIYGCSECGDLYEVR